MNSRKMENSDSGKGRQLHNWAVEIVIRFNALLKSAKIYESNNALFQRQRSLLFSLLHKVLVEAGQAVFGVRQSTLFFNNIRLKYGASNFHFFKFLVEELKKNEIGGLHFLPGLKEDELETFVLLFVKGQERKDHPFETLISQIKQRGVQNILLEKVLPSEFAPRREKHAARAFFLGITHLEETFASIGSQSKIQLSTTRRLIQSIFNHIVDNEAFVQGLTNIKNFHEYTLNHSMNVCILAIALGRRLGLDRNELVDLGISAFFHDFGKLDTPPEILDKPARLDDKERGIIERHPYQGAEKLVQVRELKQLPLQAIHVAMEHHIKEDFSGYPRYFKRQSVNLFSKIVKIVDFFDAITTPRVYRPKAFGRDEALVLMLQHSGKEFHPLLLKEFIRMMGIYPVGTLVALDTKEVGIVVENNPDPNFLLRPRVKIIADSQGTKLDGEIVDLSEVNPETNKYQRTIVKTLDPDKYQVRVADYLLAQAEE